MKWADYKMSEEEGERLREREENIKQQHWGWAEGASWRRGLPGDLKYGQL